MTVFTIGRFDAGGYYVVMEDGIVICRSKSLGVVKRIAHALCVVALAKGPVDGDNRAGADTVNIVELKEAVGE
jgi:hypothetical protein